MNTTQFKNLARMAVAPWNERGIAQTLRSIRGCLHAQSQERRDAFDARFGTDTGRRMTLESLGATGPDVPALWRYFPTLQAPFRRLLAALPLPCDESVFVDLGSGKGRALLMAAELPFRRIVGVELSPELHRIAERNVARYRAPSQRCHSFELVCMDAAEWEPPADSSVYYLFQPFPRDTMAAVLDNLGRSLRAHPRPFCIAYMNPLFHDMVMDTGLMDHHRSGQATRPGEFDWSVYLHQKS